MDTEEKPTHKIVETGRKMIETYRSLIKVNAVESASLGVSWGVVGILIFILCLFVLLFAGLGSAWWLGERMDNMKAGFFIVGGFFLVTFVFIALAAKSLIIPPLRDLFIKKVYDEDN
jgi:4-amino-4-deoxy-L-arabinose transferase-like glycosyltransferase